MGCAKKIVQVGVREVVYSQEYGMDQQSRELLMEGGVRLRQHKPLHDVMAIVANDNRTNGYGKDPFTNNLHAEDQDHNIIRLGGLTL